MAEPLAWSITANNMCVREIQRLRQMAWDALLDQYRSGAHPSRTRKAILNSSATSFGIEKELFTWPEGHHDLWVIFCTSPDCNLRPMSKWELMSGEASAHFETHGLSLDNDQIINLFGFQGNHWRISVVPVQS